MHPMIIESVRYSAWATRKVINVCRGLEAEQLGRPGLGYGSVMATLNHVVLSDGGYLRIFWVERPEWAADKTPTEDLDLLDERVSEAAALWGELLSSDFDGERLLVLDGGTYECPASVVVTQALQHATGHREQIRMNLRGLGVTPPDLQPWEFALETEHARWLKGDA